MTNEQQAKHELILGEYRRVFDERYRIALPPELTAPLGGENAECVLAKEREGCLSLWNAHVWSERFDSGVALLQAKLDTLWVKMDLPKVQHLSRLISTRSRPVKLGQRGRLLVPEGFREFLAVEPNSEVLVVGAGVCLEIWHPEAWKTYLREDIGQFNTLFHELVS